MRGSVREVNSVGSRLEELTQVLDLGLGAGHPVEAHGIQPSFVQLHHTLGDDDGDVALGGAKVLQEVHSKQIHPFCKSL